MLALEVVVLSWTADFMSIDSGKSLFKSIDVMNGKIIGRVWVEEGV
jgi:hypothetical protein